jgi:hypothetical protein
LAKLRANLRSSHCRVIHVAQAITANCETREFRRFEFLLNLETAPRLTVKGRIPQ